MQQVESFRQEVGDWTTQRLLSRRLLKLTFLSCEVQILVQDLVESPEGLQPLYPPWTGRRETAPSRLIFDVSF